MIKEKTLKSFKQGNKGYDVIGVIRTMYPKLEVEAILSSKKHVSKKN